MRPTVAPVEGYRPTTEHAAPGGAGTGAPARGRHRHLTRRFAFRLLCDGFAREAVGDMFDTYAIRLARRKDLHRLPAIERSASARFRAFDIADVGPSVPLEVLEQRQAQGQVWVALDHRDCPVGFAVASVIDGYGHLDELDVLERHGRKGLGKRLVTAVCRWARRSGLAGVTLSTMRVIPWNAPFYEKLGFKVVPEGELTGGLARLRQLEARVGLPVEQRVVMRRRF